MCCHLRKRMEMYVVGFLLRNCMYMYKLSGKTPEPAILVTPGRTTEGGGKDTGEGDSVHMLFTL